MEFIEIDPKKAFETAVEKRDSGEKLLVCGSAETVEYLKEGMESNDIDEVQVASAASEIDATEWFKEKEKEAKEEFEEDELEMSEIVGEWPENISDGQSFTLATDILSGDLLETVYGVKIEAKDSSEVLIKFKYGGWNDCPNTEEQIAIWKYWEEKYGAKVVGVGNDIIEAYVENPPKTKEEAMVLAYEQYYYCYDIVDQGCETISNLAASLLNSKVWYFWWD